MRVFDSHIHLDALTHPAAPTDPAVTDYAALVPAGEPADTAAALASLRVPGVRFAVALHPWYLLEADVGTPRQDPRWEDLVRLASDPRVAAVGETGLDHHRFTDPAVRRRVEHWFRWQAILAREVDKPLVIHCVRAHADCARVLADLRGGFRGVVHAFAGSPEEAATYRRLGLLVGIGPAVTRPHSSRVRAAATLVPDDQLLVETDAPYMAADARGSGNGIPDDIVRVVHEVATLRGTTPDAVAELTWANAERLFGPAPAA